MILKILKISSADDILKLHETIPKDFLPDTLLHHFCDHLGERVRSICIEYPYVDKDYRSTYYGFYAKRHRRYGSFCFRLHLFDEKIASVDDISESAASYLGSIVLRPTEVATLGRTLLSPEAVKGFKGYICQTEFVNNLQGLPLKIKTFPHIMQDTDVTVCAHAVCWMITRYYSERYTLYPERLAFDIAMAVTDVSSGRTIPSRGITLGQVSEILTTIGFQTEVCFSLQKREENSRFFMRMH